MVEESVATGNLKSNAAQLSKWEGHLPGCETLAGGWSKALSVTPIYARMSMATRNTNPLACLESNTPLVRCLFIFLCCLAELLVIISVCLNDPLFSNLSLRLLGESRIIMC